jgi:hypothetical protein
VENDPLNVLDELGLAPTFEGTAGNYHVNTARGGTKVPAYTVDLKDGKLVFGEMKPHPTLANPTAHFVENYKPTFGPKAKDNYKNMRRILHNDFITAVNNKNQTLADKLAAMGRATRNGALGKLAIGLGLVLSPMAAMASAKNIANYVQDYGCDKMQGNDDWAYVDALMVRQELNQHGLFAGDIAMRMMLR